MLLGNWESPKQDLPTSPKYSLFTGEVSNIVTTITVLLCVMNSLLIYILSSQYSQTLIDCFSGISEFEYRTLEGLKWREVNPEIFEFGIVGTECWNVAFTETLNAGSALCE
jgi:hypothetical protein